LAALRSLNELLSKDLKFGVHTYVGEGIYRITAYGEDAARLMRILAVAAPSAGGGYLSPKFDGFVGEAQVAVRPGEGSIRRTPKGRVAAGLVISEGDIKVKYNVYLRRDAIVLQFQSSDRGRAELAARLLRLAGVSVEVKRVSERGVWQVWAATDMLAVSREELRKAIADIVKAAAESGWVDADKAERWLDKLEKGRAAREGWPKYYVGLDHSGALEVKYQPTNPSNMEREVQRLKAMGLEEGRHFTVKMPEGGKAGYVRVLREGLERAAWLSVHGEGERQRLAAEFVDLILERARKKGGAVYEKALEIVRRGKAVGSLRLADVRGAEVFVGGRRYVVDVLGGGAEFGKGRSGKTLLRITITAEVDGVKSDYEVAFGRYGAKNEARGFAAARANAPGGKEADAERFAALVEALTGEEPRIYRRSDGKIDIVCGREHLDGFARYAELAEAIEKWLEETGRR
ncbi:MAG: PaRep2b protein, partial [Thermoproteus sp.]